jgi:hypothetical protein
MDRRSSAPSCGDLRQADETKAHHAGFVIGARISTYCPDQAPPRSVNALGFPRRIGGTNECIQDHVATGDSCTARRPRQAALGWAHGRRQGAPRGSVDWPVPNGHGAWFVCGLSFLARTRAAAGVVGGSDSGCGRDGRNPDRDQRPLMWANHIEAKRRRQKEAQQR